MSIKERFTLVQACIGGHYLTGPSKMALLCAKFELIVNAPKLSLSGNRQNFNQMKKFEIVIMNRQ
jgi:hypothetical protein